MSGNKKINFSSGPAALPPEVLQEASEAIINYNNTGLSILELQHRGKYFEAINDESRTLVKELCGLGDDYEVLWLQGGGRLQFAMIPMNFLGEHESAGFIDSGFWAHNAAEYAAHYGNAITLSSSESDHYRHLPEWPASIPEDLSYLHFTTNNTIYGTQFPNVPKTNVPLIADMSSDILSRKTDYSNCAMFYAVAQKNIGAAGITLVAVNKYLLGNIKRKLPPMLDYKAHADARSLLNTAAVFGVYTSLLTLRWIKQKGIDVIETENNRKAALLYNEIERNSIFHSNIKKEDRSKMNVCFGTENKEIDTAFTEFCSKQNITGIDGHRYVGSFRVSLYNAIPLTAVEKMVSVMQEFEHEYLKAR
ncbi:3-phosphoserine/phosphohydroxythreonine transaminase [Polluticoccus soli]|uniref:3-phosphoserine/phosphohydroxythreonine transaminase n=1 Tax=Polluticoccus soli TaxID=3034150 RepID=UPI0023E27BFE|nr:3-phosphoserine/phosphohydroxythreonine transaminase [Flavipsychrobacter sp. JY13-12]